VRGNSAEQKINVLSNTHTKCMKETCMAYTLYMSTTTNIHLGSEKKVTGVCRRRRKNPCVGENKGCEMTRYETRFLGWPSHFISRASVPEVTENSQEEFSVCTVHPIRSVPGSGNTLPSSPNTLLEKHIHIFTISQEDLTVATSANCYQGGPAKGAKK